MSGQEINALLVAGQLAGLSQWLDADALERFLASKPEDFRYEAMCRAAIEFKRATFGNKKEAPA